MTLFLNARLSLSNNVITTSLHSVVVASDGSMKTFVVQGDHQAPSEPASLAQALRLLADRLEGGSE